MTTRCRLSAEAWRRDPSSAYQAVFAALGGGPRANSSTNCLYHFTLRFNGGRSADLESLSGSREDQEKARTAMHPSHPSLGPTDLGHGVYIDVFQNSSHFSVGGKKNIYWHHPHQRLCLRPSAKMYALKCTGEDIQ